MKTEEYKVELEDSPRPRRRDRILRRFLSRINCAMGKSQNFLYQEIIRGLPYVEGVKGNDQSLNYVQLVFE